MITLPQGNAGIAAGYAKDVGIASHPSVLFQDTFDKYSTATAYADMVMSGPYGNMYQQNLTSFVTDEAADKSMRLRLSPGFYNNADLTIAGVDVVFVRVEMKLSPAFRWLMDGNGYASSAHAGITISASYDGAGIKPNGTNHFLALFEPTKYLGEAQPGYLHSYVYHMNQGGVWGDHLYSDGRKVPEGSKWTPTADFAPMPVRQPPLDRWFTVEMRGEANTPGQKNGRVTVWLNGEIISDIGGIQFRSVNTLKWDLVQIGLGQGSLGGTLPTQYVWFDNLVVATDYIGPMVGSVVTPPVEPPVEPPVPTALETRVAALEAKQASTQAQVAALSAEYGQRILAVEEKARTIDVDLAGFKASLDQKFNDLI